MLLERLGEPRRSTRLPKREFGSSRIREGRSGRHCGAIPPALDLEQRSGAAASACVELISEGLVRVGARLRDGGLAVALAESAVSRHGVGREREPRFRRTMPRSSRCSAKMRAASCCLATRAVARIKQVAVNTALCGDHSARQFRTSWRSSVDGKIVVVAAVYRIERRHTKAALRVALHRNRSV